MSVNISSKPHQCRNTDYCVDDTLGNLIESNNGYNIFLPFSLYFKHIIQLGANYYYVLVKNDSEIVGPVDNSKCHCF
jgi:hypothetical protein